MESGWPTACKRRALARDARTGSEADGEIAGFNRLDGRERESLNSQFVHDRAKIRIGDPISEDQSTVLHYNGFGGRFISDYYPISNRETGIYHREYGVSKRYDLKYWYAYRLPSARFGNDPAGTISLDFESLDGDGFNDLTTHNTDYNAPIRIGDTIPRPSPRVLKRGIFNNYEAYALNNIFANIFNHI